MPDNTFWPEFIENPAVKNTYTKILDSNLPTDIFAFQDEEAKITDILRFRNLSQGEDVKVEILASFNSIFTHVTSHQNRVICDSFVYNLDDWSELAWIDTKYSVMAVAPMFHQIILIGHDRYR